MTTITATAPDPRTIAAPRRGLGAMIRPDRLQATAVKILTLLLLLYGSTRIDNYASAANFAAIMYAVAAVGIAALGMAFITLSGNLFMLSMGATAAMATIIFASSLHLGLAATMAVVLAAGAAVGLAQGLTVGLGGANPIITTIGFSSVITGIGALWSGGLTVIGQGDASWLATGTLFGVVPNQIILFVLLAVIGEIVVAHMRFGRELRLIGLNRAAASVAGLRVPRTLTIAFVIAGAAAALSGALTASQAAQGNLKLAAGLDFDAIAAVLVGGISIRGGRGRIADAAFGAVFLAVITNILLIEGMNVQTQLAIKGAVVIASVMFGALAGRVRT